MRRKGFTLIELLAVIIILGILMLIAIPSVTSYINNSRKESYIDTVNEIIKGANILINSGEIEINDPDTTYYVPCTCVNLENGEPKSPFGKFDPAYVVVTYNGENYNYYFTGKDITNMGIPTITKTELLNKEIIVSNIGNIDTSVGIEGTSKVAVYSNDCSNYTGSDTYQFVTGEGEAPLKNAAAYISRIEGLYDVADAKRYVGGTPDNYVWFNEELWRIIGVYGDKLKIITASSIGKRQITPWNSPKVWGETPMSIYLNGTYYNSLAPESKKLIVEGDFNVGASQEGPNPMDNYEKSKHIIWRGKVGIMISYEYLFATSDTDCYSTSGYSYIYGCGLSDKNWLMITRDGSDTWTMTPHEYSNSQGFSTGKYETSETPLNYFTILRSGYLSDDASGYSYNTFPTVYLNSNTIITGGNGTEDTPYLLDLPE